MIGLIAALALALGHGDDAVAFYLDRLPNVLHGGVVKNHGLTLVQSFCNPAMLPRCVVPNSIHSCVGDLHEEAKNRIQIGGIILGRVQTVREKEGSRLVQSDNVQWDVADPFTVLDRVCGLGCARNILHPAANHDIPGWDAANVLNYQVRCERNKWLALFGKVSSDPYLASEELIDYQPGSNLKGGDPFGGVRRISRVIGGAFGETSGRYSSPHGDEPNDQPKKRQDASALRPNRPFIGAVSGLPLGAQIGGSVVLTLLACLSQAVGVVVWWRGRGRMGLCLIALSFVLLTSSIPLWW